MPRDWGSPVLPPDPSPEPALLQPLHRSRDIEGPEGAILLPLHFCGTNLPFSSALSAVPAVRFPPSLSPLPSPCPGRGCRGRGAQGGSSAGCSGPAGPAPEAKRGPCPFCPSTALPLLFFAEIISAVSLLLLLICFFSLVSPLPSRPGH